MENTVMDSIGKFTDHLSVALITIIVCIIAVVLSLYMADRKKSKHLTFNGKISTDALLESRDYMLAKEIAKPWIIGFFVSPVIGGWITGQLFDNVGPDGFIDAVLNYNNVMSGVIYGACIYMAVSALGMGIFITRKGRLSIPSNQSLMLILIALMLSSVIIILEIALEIDISDMVMVTPYVLLSLSMLRLCVHIVYDK